MTRGDVTTAADQNGGGATAASSTEPPDFLKRPLTSDKPFTDLNTLLKVAGWAESADTTKRLHYDLYYTRLYDRFVKYDKKCQLTVFKRIRSAVYLHGDKQRLQVEVDPQCVAFNWSKATKVLYEAEALQQDVHLWLKLSPDHDPMMQRLTAFALQVLAAIEDENRKHTSDHSRRPSAEFSEAMSAAEDVLRRIEGELEAAAQRASIAVYAQGMLLGILAIAALAGGIAWIFSANGVRFENEIALITGAIGAVVSVMQRLSAGKLHVDYRAAGRMVRILGAIRPIIGGVFGMLVFALIEGEFLPWVTPPEGTGALVAFLAVVGFLSGFNERFAQDMLGEAGKAFEPTLGTTQPTPTPANSAVPVA